MRILMLIKNYFHNTGQWWLEFLPKLTIYLVCAFFFQQKVTVLLKQYFEHDTTSMIDYSTPDEIEFPAFTICGCCLSRATRESNDSSYLKDEKYLINRHNALEVLNNYSVSQDQIVINCNFVFDSRLPDKRIRCDQVQKVLEIIHQGRKCFTFFTKIPDSIHEPIVRGEQRYSSYVYIEVNFTSIYTPFHVEDMFQDADISLAIHRANILPTQLNTEFTRIDHCMVYEFNFRKQQTTLLEKPYATNCKKYSANTSKFMHRNISTIK